MEPVIRVLVIWILAWALLLSTRRLVKLFKTQFGRKISKPADIRRIDTLSGVFQHGATLVILAVAGMLTLGEIGISIAPVLATAGVAGIAVGFGAQSLVRDFFTGLFLLIENQVSEGDVIEAAGKAGYVEEVTLRHIRIRDDDGSVHFIPNGIITTVTNKSREYAFAVIDFPVPRQDNLDQAFQIMRQTGRELRQDPLLGSSIIDELEVAGVEKMEDASIVVRCRIKVAPLTSAPVRREFLKRVKDHLDHARSTAPPKDDREQAPIVRH